MIQSGQLAFLKAGIAIPSFNAKLQRPVHRRLDGSSASPCWASLKKAKFAKLRCMFGEMNKEGREANDITACKPKEKYWIVMHCGSRTRQGQHDEHWRNNCRDGYQPNYQP